MTTLSPIERLKLVQQLRAERQNLVSAISPMEKLRAVKAVRMIREKLGEAATAAEPPADPPAQTPEPDAKAAEYLAVLSAVTTGAHDAKGLEALYATIKEAVEGLNSIAALEGEAVDIANAAITHWAELEVSLNV